MSRDKYILRLWKFGIIPNILELDWKLKSKRWCWDSSLNTKWRGGNDEFLISNRLNHEDLHRPIFSWVKPRNYAWGSRLLNKFWTILDYINTVIFIFILFFLIPPFSFLFFLFFVLNLCFTLWRDDFYEICIFQT